MAPFDRSCTTFYWSAIVNIALSCIVFFSYLTLNNIVTLKSPLGGGYRRNSAMTFGMEKLEWRGYPMVKKF